MTDIAYEAGIKAILEDFTGGRVLDGELYALIVMDTYTPDSTETDMATIESNLWDGVTSNGGNTIDDAIELYDGTTIAAVTIDIVSNKITIKCDDIEFGTVSDEGTTGAEPKYVVIFTKRNATSASDHAWPLVALEITWDPNAADTYTFIVDADGICLWDPQ